MPRHPALYALDLYLRFRLHQPLLSGHLFQRRQALLHDARLCRSQMDRTTDGEAKMSLLRNSFWL